MLSPLPQCLHHGILAPLSIWSRFHQIRAHPFLFSISCRPFSLYVSAGRSISHATVPENSAEYNRVKVNCSGIMTVESLRLVPLGEKIISYFAERKISEDILRRNAVMQPSGGENAIAFTYKRSGVLVTCKYRSLDKKFWREKGKERIFYGLDDICGADEIIIVEGEIDKLSMEEAGFLHCVSVPDGAPSKVSAKLPSVEKDSAFQYLWNCKEHLDKASRIILATDGDPAGKVLAEELARRLGRERCWRVCWPKKDEFSYYKDANEVLMNLGSAALRDVVHSAELYSMHNFNNVKNEFCVV